MTETISGKVVDILNQSIFGALIHISEGRIASIERSDSVPDDAPYIMPGFIDSHVHIESSMLLPENFAREAVRHGTTAIVTDPHEIANVLGCEGVEFMIRNCKRVRMRFCFCAPSCVPSTPFETAGASIGPQELRDLLASDDIYALAEMMNYPGVLLKDEQTMLKLECARQAGKPIDGHAPAMRGKEAAEYIGAGISTDHECVDLSEARWKKSLGMNILLREGSASRDLDRLAPLLSEDASLLMMCSDDIHPDSLLNGHIESMVRRTVGMGYPLWSVLRAACVNPVFHYGIPTGLLREGDPADFIEVDSLEEFNILSTWIDGVKVYDRTCGTTAGLTADASPLGELPNRFHAEEISPEALEVRAVTDSMRVIVALDGRIFTLRKFLKPKVCGGKAVCDTGRDLLKIAVYNRYSKASPAVGFIQGFGLVRGAIASSIAHDSHNIVAVGTSDNEIAQAINAVVRMRGGLAACCSGDTVTLPLPVAGLMSAGNCAEVADGYIALNMAAARMGCSLKAPFMTLSFMALPVIPELKITDLGLFDVDSFTFTELFD